MSNRVLTSRRRALKPYRCDECGGWIKSQSVYLRHTMPGDDWNVIRECSGCATMFGRAGLLEDK